MDISTFPHDEELDFEIPPGEDELPCDDDTPMETVRHRAQMEILTQSLFLWWKDRPNVFVGGNMFVHFNLEWALNRDFRGPDFFAVQGVKRRERKSWVVWLEGKGPDVVIELLSESTAAKDRGEKKLVYQDQLRVPEYFWYDPFSGELAGFRLQGSRYVPIVPDAQDRLLSQELGLVLLRRPGWYWDIETAWLRFATPEGVLLPTPVEVAEAAQREAEAAQQRVAELEALLAQYRSRHGDLADGS